MKRDVWFKASASTNNNGCVEVMITDAEVKVRDTKQEGCGPVHAYPHAEWAAFLAGVRNGEFDL